MLRGQRSWLGPAVGRECFNLNPRSESLLSSTPPAGIHRFPSRRRTYDLLLLSTTVVVPDAIWMAAWFGEASLCLLFQTRPVGYQCYVFPFTILYICVYPFIFILIDFYIRISLTKSEVLLKYNIVLCIIIKLTTLRERNSPNIGCSSSQFVL